MPARNRDERNCLRVVTNLLNEGGRFLDNFVETVFAPLNQKSEYDMFALSVYELTLVVSILLTATMS